ncbi:NAD dependent epimerase/dehydratase family protein [Terribacillus halophilus]|uniref:NAD dependent epimerase/dehydratase family protein n=1 Tax=Terribacillus halophilus TaxID=361279 RepID=A0A1G6W815_9BACI|nr:NAD dependent epimerase/dehydratase family protein [Terribacillus halophilus]
MKIIVIGATGAIGSEVIKKLDNYHEVIKVGSNSSDYRLDVTSPLAIEKMFKGIQNIDAVSALQDLLLSKGLKKMTPEVNAVAVQSKLLGQINLVLIGQHYLNPNGTSL